MRSQVPVPVGVTPLPWRAQLLWFAVHPVMFSLSLSSLNLAVPWQSPSLFKEGKNILV